MVGIYGAPQVPPVEVGVTRVSDLSPLFANDNVGVFEVSGAELLQMQEKASAAGSGILMPGFNGQQILRDRRYTVALPTGLLWPFSWVMKSAPKEYRIADIDMRDVIERFLDPQ